MSRKTKEQKKLAEYRRRLKLLGQNSKSSENRKSENSSPLNNLDTKTQTKESPNETKNKQDFNKDLKRSLLFISLIITLEIAIYFAKL